jgi:putative ABC transport system substrate-binding protein
MGWMAPLRRLGAKVLIARNRREFITLLGGAAVAWPIPARAQDIQRVRRIGMLQTLAADDPEGHTRNAAFFRELERLGWADGLNVRIDLRSAAGHPDTIRNYATELVALAPDLIIALGSATYRRCSRQPQPYPSYS